MYVRIIKFLAVKIPSILFSVTALSHRCEYSAHFFVSHIPVYWLVVQEIPSPFFIKLSSDCPLKGLYMQFTIS
jgi:hypothetical protein